MIVIVAGKSLIDAEGKQWWHMRMSWLFLLYLHEKRSFPNQKKVSHYVRMSDSLMGVGGYRGDQTMTISKKNVMSAIENVRNNGKKRNFTQTIEMYFNLKDLNLKKPEEQVEFFTQTPKPVGSKKVCAIVGPETEPAAKEACDKVILQSELDEYKGDKKAAKKLAENYDFFIAQANLMGPIAAAFGRVFGPRGKMPNPKAGCVVPPKATIKPLYERLQSTVRVSAKKFPVIHVVVGTEEMSDEDIAENIMYFYDQVEHHLPRELHNVKSVLVKTTMGSPVKLA